MAYEALRIPRVTPVLRSSHQLGATQQRRADSWWYNLRRELEIKLDVYRFGTLPIMKPGAAYDFRKHVAAYVEKQDRPPTAAEGEAPPTAEAAGGGALRAEVAVGAALVAAAALALVAMRRR